jgi:hypothetical protein
MLGRDERLAPEAHRAFRVELLRLAEGALRLGMVEAEGHDEALVELGLRLGLRGADLEVELPRFL